VTLLFIDLDGFKAVNDTHGHLCGDEVLTQTAERLAGAVREGDLVARLGGDEFAVLVDHAGDQRIAQSLVERMQHALRAPIRLSNGATVTVGASIGLHHGEAALGADGLVHAADTAMYQLKAARRPAAAHR